MANFLQSVADYYLEHEQGVDWSRLRFVFPSHRAGRFFRNALRNSMGERIVFGLYIQNISELITAKAKLIVPDKLTQIFELYTVYRRVFEQVPGANTDFEFFFSWAPVFISDFSDIDKYMVDAEQIFANIRDAHDLSDDYSHLSDEQRKAIFDFWGVVLGTPADPDAPIDLDYKRKFNLTYSHLFELYTLYREHLSQKGMAYDGMLYREVAEEYADRHNPKAFDADDVRYVFIGFNALTTAEQRLFAALRDAGRADFFWDYSPDVLSRVDEGQDLGAGRFLNHLLEHFPAPDDYELPQAAGHPSFTITAFAYSQSQVSGVSEFLQKYYAREQAEQTAIVLADENMLLPVLGALPQHIDRVNVTMGYPLKQSQVYGLVSLLSRLQSSSATSVGSFAARNVQPILQHPCIFSPLSAKLMDDILRNNKSRIDITLLCVDNDSPDGQLLNAIFRKVTDPAEVPAYLHRVFKMVYNKCIGQQPDNDADVNLDTDENTHGNELLRECIYQVLAAINRFGDYMKRGDIDIHDVPFVFRLFDGIVRLETVDLKGEPLMGLQIMGYMETRALDFDNIVALDMNEGVFPKTSTSNSFIPHTIRGGFGLPTYAFRDSIFAYYFFRLMHRAKHVDLYYTTSGGDEAKGISRFLLQLMYQFKLPVEHRVATHSLNIAETSTLTIKKTPEILESLYQAFSRLKKDGTHSALSPSKLNDYIACPMKLYYSKVLRLSDSDEVVEEVDTRIMGTIYHYVMENLLRQTPYLSAANKAYLRKDCRRIEDLLCASFGEQLGYRVDRQDDLDGRNFLSYDVLLDYILASIDKEKDDTNVVACELQTSVPFTLSNGRTIYVGGIVDRVHREADGKLCILDYKTGYVHKDNFTLKEVKTEFSNHKLTRKALLQELVYAFVLRQLSAQDPDYAMYRDNMHFRVLEVKKVKTEGFNPVVYREKEELTYDDISADLEDSIRQKIEEIFDPEIDFECVVDEHTCKNCDFHLICQYSKRGVEDA